MCEKKTEQRSIPLWELFWTFARVGVMTFGGGYAMLPILQREVADNKKWATEEELADYYAIGQCTPGIIAANVATFVGQKLRGIPGAVAATLGQVFPGLVIISVIAAFLVNFSEVPIIQDAFAGIRACVCVLILNAVLKLFKGGVVDLPSFLIFAAVLVGAIVLPLSPVAFILAAGVAGVIIRWVAVCAVRRKGAEK